MATSDIAAVGIVMLCGLLGLRGWFRWASGLIIGLVRGCLVLGAIGVTSKYPWSGRMGTFFESGAMAPYAGRQLENVADRIGVEISGDTGTDKKDNETQDRGGESWARNNRAR